MKKGVVFIGQFPPPVTGFSQATQNLSHELSTRYELEIANTSGSGSRGLAFHLLRLMRTLLAAILIYRLRRSHEIVYVACDSGLGILYALLLVIIARSLGQRLYLHHHSYAYITRRSSLMAMLLRLGSDGTTHIVLAPEMGQALANRYGRCLDVIVLSNIALLPDPEEVPIGQPDRPLTVGLLSNLSPEKGLLTFLELMKQAKRRGMNLRGVLAGPASKIDQQRIADAVENLNGALEYRGPMFGQEKRRFYEDIDVFLFPTEYANEAQPLVIFEALAAGRPVIANDRGCIRSQVGNTGVVVDPCDNFIEAALIAFERRCFSGDRLAAASVTAIQTAAQERELAYQTLVALFDARACGIYPNSSKIAA